MVEKPIIHLSDTTWNASMQFWKCLKIFIGSTNLFFSMFWFLNSPHTHYDGYYSAENSHFKGKRRKSHQDIIRWSWNNKQMVLMVQKIIFRVRQDSQMAQNGHFRRLLSILGYMYWLKMPFFNGKRVNLTFWLNPTIWKCKSLKYR